MIENKTYHKIAKELTAANRSWTALTKVYLKDLGSEEWARPVLDKMMAITLNNLRACTLYITALLSRGSSPQTTKPPNMRVFTPDQQKRLTELMDEMDEILTEAIVKNRTQT